VLLPEITTGYVPHAPIRIGSDEELQAMAAAEGWRGNGTATNPFVIENLEIKGNAVPGIWIENTTLYVVIDSCRVTGQGAPAIRIENATHIRITACEVVGELRAINVTQSQVDYCQIMNASTGLYLEYCHQVGVQRTTVTASDWGVLIRQSSNCSVEQVAINETTYGVCIDEVFNTTLSDLIVNNTLYAVYATTSYNFSVANATIRRSFYGVHISDCSNATLVNVRVVTAERTGVLLSECTGIIMENLSVVRGEDGVVFLNSRDSVLHGTSILESTYGIVLRYSKKIQLQLCIINNCTYGLGIEGDMLEHFLHNVESVVVNRHPVLYLSNATGVELEDLGTLGFLGIVNVQNASIARFGVESGYQGVLLAYTQNVTLQQSNVTLCYRGVHAYRCTNLTLREVSIKSCKDAGMLIERCLQAEVVTARVTSCGDGLRLRNCQKAVIRNSTFAYSAGAGLCLSGCANCTITGCNASYNTLGIDLWFSSDNWIYNNIFVNYNNWALHSSPYNQWNTTRSLGPSIVGGPYLGGNYWGDYRGTDPDGDGIGNSPYRLDATNIDYLPLWIPHPPDDIPPYVAVLYPRNGTFLAQRDVVIVWNASDNSGLHHADLWIDGKHYSLAYNATMNTTLSLLLEDLEEGEYEAHLTVYDLAGNNQSLLLVFGVDTSLPITLYVEPPNNAEEEGPLVEFAIHAYDQISHIENVSLYINNTYYGDLQYNGTCYVTRVELENGTYIWYCILCDAAGNRAYTMPRMLIVGEKKPPTTPPQNNRSLMLLIAAVCGIGTAAGLLYFIRVKRVPKSVRH